MWQVEAWSQGKSEEPAANEDVALISKDVVVLADGATDKNGIVYPSGKTGGRWLAEIATETALVSLTSGYELAHEVTGAVQRFYRLHNPGALVDPRKRSATTLVAARKTDSEVVVTQIGDTNIRVTLADGTHHVLTNDKLIDTENAIERSRFIRAKVEAATMEHGHEPNLYDQAQVAEDARMEILAKLHAQYVFQNSFKDKVRGYGAVDGTEIPRTFMDGTETGYVKEFRFPLANIVSLELASDGFYGVFPDRPSVVAYQALYRQIHAEDPNKYLRHLSTKSRDDATVIIVTAP